MKESRFSWIVTLKDGSKKVGIMQVDADELEMRDGALVFSCENAHTKYISLTIAYGCWKSACIISQLTGYRAGVSILALKDDERVPL